jgi:hypothetical protein
MSSQPITTWWAPQLARGEGGHCRVRAARDGNAGHGRATLPCARRAVRPRKGPGDERIGQELERTAHAVGMARFGKAEGGDVPVRRRVGAEGQQCRWIHPFFERVKRTE